MGRGRRPGGGTGKQSAKLRDEIINKAKNSKFAGVRRNAEKGIENYSFKNYKPVGEKEIGKAKNLLINDYGDKTVITGIVKEKNIVYVGLKNSKFVTDFKEKQKTKHEEAVKKLKNKKDVNIRTTTTYDRWRKSNQKKFDSWYGPINK